MPAAIAILVGKRGRGTNMASLARACVRKELPAEVRLVVSASGNSPGALEARALGLSVAIIDPDDEQYTTNLLLALQSQDIDWICLAGFMRLLPAEVLAAYPNRVLNIHPALLPKFGGKGMYGIRVHEAVLASGEPESGCTIHLVNERYDEGRIIFQAKCPVLPDDTPETLAARVLSLEHIAYPLALKSLIEPHGSQGKA